MDTTIPEWDLDDWISFGLIPVLTLVSSVLVWDEHPGVAIVLVGIAIGFLVAGYLAHTANREFKQRINGY